MKHFFFPLLSVMLVMVLFSSCQSKEERIIGRLQNLTEQIQKHGDNMTSDEWEQIQADYSQIHQDLKSGDYEFTDEQLMELAEAEGSFIGACCEQGGKNLGKSLNNVLKVGAGFLKGLTGGD